MVFSNFHFYSQTLGMQTSIYVLMPEPAKLWQSKSPVPVLYLLHGLCGDHTMWLRQTRIEQFASQYRVCVVMPAVGRSFYMDMAHGAAYDTFIAEELPRVIESYFPVSRKREHRFAAGMSMGGYGAMKLGLSRPSRYAAVASLSGAVEMENAYHGAERGPAGFRLCEMDSIYGSEEQLKKGPGNLSLLAAKLAKKPEKAPRMYMACGTEDFLFEANESFIAKFGEALSIEYHTEPGVHDWAFWDKYIEKVLAWLPLEKVDGAV